MKQAMDDIYQLIEIKERLNELQDNLLMARTTRDKRSREKNIREARIAIGNYALFLPLDVRYTFEKEVGANALNVQHADDIGECITVIDNRIKELKQQTNL